MQNSQLDCLVIGHNEPPFDAYEKLLRQYGEDSEAYRDLQLSFVEVGGRKMTYIDLFNHVFARAAERRSRAAPSFYSGDIPCLSAAYLTNYVRKCGFSAEYINLFQQEKDRLAAYLREEKPRCVAITTTLYVLNFPASEVVEFVRLHNPDAQTIVGGPLIANHARNYQGSELESALKDIGADIYVIEGQGEHTLSQIISCLRNGGDLSEVPNLFYRGSGGYQRTAPLPENNPLDDYYIDWECLDGSDLGPTLQTRTARSCAFSCAFCNYPQRAGKLSLASLETIEKELESMHRRGNVKNVVFIDDTFNVPLNRFKEICRLMINKRYGFNWYSYFRCSNADQEAIDLLAESGCAGVFLGIESGSPTILKNMSKAAKVEQYLRGMERLHKNGVLTFASIITGFPGETEATVQETADFLKESQPDYFRTQLWYCEKGTPIELQREKYGIEGDGFVWQHNTMDSLEAIEHIERMFLSLDLDWLPQWSFDFWIIPYYLGRGMSRDGFKSLMREANRMLAAEVAVVPAAEKAARQETCLANMVEEADRQLATIPG